MFFDTLPHSISFISSRYKAAYNTDYTLDATGEAVVAWNPALGAPPTPDQIRQGVLGVFKRDLVSRINQYAGDVRASYLSDGLYIVEEYHLAEKEAADYKTRGFSVPVPTTVSDYALILNTTDYQSVAEIILSTAQQLRTVLTIIRRIRLTAKAAIMLAPTIDGAQQAFEASWAQLTTVKAPQQ